MNSDEGLGGHRSRKPWIAYVNDGSITDASGRANQRWLESAFLQKQAGVWKVLFMHSTRGPTQPQARSISTLLFGELLRHIRAFRKLLNSLGSVGSSDPGEDCQTGFYRF